LSGALDRAWLPLAHPVVKAELAASRTIANPHTLRK
jgi:hypothetical protein